MARKSKTARAQKTPRAAKGQGKKNSTLRCGSNARHWFTKYGGADSKQQHKPAKTCQRVGCEVVNANYRDRYQVWKAAQ